MCVGVRLCVCVLSSRVQHRAAPSLFLSRPRRSSSVSISSAPAVDRAAEAERKSGPQQESKDAARQAASQPEKKDGPRVMEEEEEDGTDEDDDAEMKDAERESNEQATGN